MSLSYDMMKEIVANGSNLVLDNSISYDTLRELVIIAMRTGAHVTLPSNLSYDILRELTSMAGPVVTVVNNTK